MKILVKRQGALGDVLCTTPIVKHLRNMWGPEAIINVETGATQAYLSNPHVTTVNAPAMEYDRTIDLNMAYENAPAQHIVDAYAKVAFDSDKVLVNKRIVFGIDPPPPERLRLATKVVSIHATKSWPSRTLSLDFWVKLSIALVNAGYSVQFLGSGSDYNINGDGIISLVGKTDLRETANLIACSSCFIASDSSLLHLAGATDTALVGIFTSVKAEYRMPYRNKQLGWNAAAVYPKGLDCYGCLAEQPGQTFLNCKRLDNICTQMISIDDILFHVKRLTTP